MIANTNTPIFNNEKHHLEDNYNIMRKTITNLLKGCDSRGH